ncbi:Asp23/Gls24 family envelope stress response protein [Paenibacillus sp. y28]|uniref:Asp23/Gls24 family envelope stress response protein n=1 Tax=Paenibacillus sp. y28 TaxID=3129110 RepID=UPI00301948D6
MSIQLQTELGKIHVSPEVISVLAGSAALECYGLVGMASRKQLMDGIAELLGKENLSRGVEIRQEQELVKLDLYIVVSYGIKISEVARSVQTKVKYMLSEVAGIHVDEINIIVQGVRISP